MSNGIHVVLGGTGGAGKAIAGALADTGLPVRAVSRRPAVSADERIESVAADITDPTQLAAGLVGAETVYVAAQPAYHQWPELFPPMLESVIEGVAAEDAKLVMVDNLYGYGPGPQPMTEETPERATDTKGATRRRMTEMLREAHRRGRLRVAIGRASDYLGPGGENSAITSLAIEPATRSRGSLRWMGSVDVPHSVAYLPDIARAYTILGTDARADGEVWHLPHPEALTGRRFLDLVNEQLPSARKTALVSKTMLRLAAPFHRVSRESLGILYQWTEPFIVDASKFQSTFGLFTQTPLPEAIASSIAAAIAESPRLPTTS